MTIRMTDCPSLSVPVPHVIRKLANLADDQQLQGKAWFSRSKEQFWLTCGWFFVITGPGSDLQLPDFSKSSCRRRRLPCVPLQRLWKRKDQETPSQPRRLHTDQLTAGVLQGEEDYRLFASVLLRTSACLTVCSECI